MSVEKLIVDHMETWTSALQTRSTAGRGSSGKIDLYGIKKLRELILELAVRGKLVPQDPNDEPASELLKRIAAEKAELVKQGKIKKQKPLPEISEEEKPFELPEGWEWARINDIASFTNGYAFKSSEFQNSGVGIVKIGDIDSSGFISTAGMSYVSEKKINVLPEEMRVNPGDMVIAMSGATTGKLGFNKTKSTFLLNQRVGKIVTYSVDKEFIYHYLSTRIEENLSISLGSAIPNISTAQINNIIIPIPPSDEQVKIIARVKLLISLCDQLEQQSLTSQDAHQQLVETLLGTLTDSQNAEELAENWARISEHFDTLFTTEASVDALKQTILQLAVMGKLVPQDPNDEPASELLKRIAQEKAQLVKEGKIKKPLPPISDEEKPFELPEGWEWCLFEDIIDIQSGITKGRNLSNRTLVKVPYLRVANVQRGYLDLTEIKQIEIPIEEKEKYQVVKGDLLITEGGDWDTVGRTTVWCHDWYIANQNHVFKGRNIGQYVDPYWLETYMNSPFSRQYFANASKQTTNLASINKTQLRGCPVAIPPSSEAKKIMSKLHIFYKLCEELKNHIQSAQQTQLHLADALTDAAVN
ncbi:restriction endonuclease subunit S [Escherichia coli]|uniref:restriction endonuclease subunit S n=1 Tax=Escherichia coli TaxID=562 RepID=UPI0000F0A7B0|nr:restriction endonuclease subunit S [Escherichia coli]ACA79329.1 restriction modification system DNA specificity domain [Escherichia coli ATCC 8739]AYB99444.1 restriction endonuclease subunit S [Escherichia coli ATCC 8739]EFC1881402.1 restriction endonuclease subunit S [Escherichia coli]EGD4760504.1 restriction endonuclease subunit S [Escherichia coli]EHY5598485.1 restriction endonuclease subunit S [Escherichia coli]